MRAGPKHGGFYSDGDPMGAQDGEVLPEYDDLSDTDSIKSTNIAHSVHGSDDEDETKYDSDDQTPSSPTPPPRPFPNSKFEKSDPSNFVFGDDDDEERKKGYKKSLDAGDVKNRKREMKTKRAQQKRQQAVQQRRAAADVSGVAKKAKWYEDATRKMRAERDGSTYMGHARKLVKDSAANLAAGAKKADDEKAAGFTERQQAYEERAARAKRPDMTKETKKEENKRGATRLKDRRRRKRATFATIERKRKQKVTTYTRKKNLDEFGIVV
jgi:hypothetical protein